MKREKPGAITNEEARGLLSMAERVLEKTKSNPKEIKKIPYRVNSRTVILVSSKKYKELKKTELLLLDFLNNTINTPLT